MKAGESFSRRKDFSLVYHSQEQRIKFISFILFLNLVFHKISVHHIEDTVLIMRQSPGLQVEHLFIFIEEY